METPGCPKILRSDPQKMHLPENLKSRIGVRVTPRWFSMETFRPVQEPPLSPAPVESFKLHNRTLTQSSFRFLLVSSFIP